jgi:hypothetical protein
MGEITMPLRGRVGRHTQEGGKHCRNWEDDQEKVSALLNRIPVADGGAGGGLRGPVVRDECSDALYQAIARFEDKYFPGQRSGFVDPVNPPMFKFMEDMVRRLEEKAREEASRSRPYAYYAKIAGVSGTDSYRGEPGWVSLEAVMYGGTGFGYGGGRGVGSSSDFDFQVTIIRPNGLGRDAISTGFMRVNSPGAEPVESVEIASLRSGALVVNFVLTKAKASGWVPNDLICHDDPGLVIAASEHFPRKEYPGSHYCLLNERETISFTAPAKNLTWKFPQLPKGS